MHPRFAEARRIELPCPAGTVEVALAEGFRLRLRGLSGLEAEDIEPLLFPRCRSIHTFGMRVAIDVVWLRDTSDGPQVAGVVERLQPRRRARVPRSSGLRHTISALELAAGEARRLGLHAGQGPRQG